MRPAEFGLTAYSTLLLPEWMRFLTDYRRAATLLAAPPGEAMPPVAVVDYSAIDSGLGGPPYPVSVVGVDRVANWSRLDAPTYEEKRKIVARCDRCSDSTAPSQALPQASCTPSSARRAR